MNYQVHTGDGENQLPEDSKDNQSFSRRIVSRKRPDGGMRFDVTLPVDPMKTIHNKKGYIPISGIIMDGKLVLFFCDRWKELTCPFCRTRVDTSKLVKGTVCDCEAEVSLVKSDKKVKRREGYQMMVVHNYDRKKKKIPVALPDHAGEFEPSTGLMDVVFERLE